MRAAARLAMRGAAATQANRVYVPMGAVGIVNDIQGPARPKRFIATSGLATCVGVFIWAGPGKAMVTHLDQDGPPAAEVDRLFPTILGWVTQFTGVPLAQCACTITYTSRQDTTRAQVNAVEAQARAAGMATTASEKAQNDWCMNLATGEVQHYVETGYGAPDDVSNDAARVQERINIAMTTMSGVSQGSMFKYRNDAIP